MLDLQINLRQILLTHHTLRAGWKFDAQTT
jgi:hypothetical protein